MDYKQEVFLSVFMSMLLSNKKLLCQDFTWNATLAEVSVWMQIKGGHKHRRHSHTLCMCSAVCPTLPVDKMVDSACWHVYTPNCPSETKSLPLLHSLVSKLLNSWSPHADVCSEITNKWGGSTLLLSQWHAVEPDTRIKKTKV